MKPLGTMILAVFLLPCLTRADTRQIDVPDATKAAAATVDRFFAALSTGDLEMAGAEHSAAEYLGGHAKHDAEFLRGAHHVPGRRTARVSGDLAWVASESELHVQDDGKPVTIASTETMVLQSIEGAWKIVHIHWSSQVRK